MAHPGPGTDGHPKRNSLDLGACVTLYLLLSPAWAPLNLEQAQTSPLTPTRCSLKAALGATGHSNELLKINCLTLKFLP